MDPPVWSATLFDGGLGGHRSWSWAPDGQGERRD